MFILRDILLPLQDHFPETTLGRERASLFVYTILSIIVPFTSSMTSNLWRCLDSLFGFEIKNKRFYTFMASPTLPWAELWQTIWGGANPVPCKLMAAYWLVWMTPLSLK
ncbi:hypothetical protein [Bathymodiolus platifrons methanotrophic gill symbiont]|uniref:hypothetical protein n=1 Tax=Bathymodiolus platifrons methanotrophic gill symbiont TaxID=113268 RepID=UPI001C8D2F5C|nr:hypothetical protein [Bathymodiolus platifrons methanotrophic gill symbiont]